MPISTSRSQIETSQRCLRLLYEQYFHAGKGLELSSAVPLDIGTAVHIGVGHLYRLPSDLRAAHEAAENTPQYASLDLQEDRDLVWALIRTWATVGAPVLRGWQVLDVEREEQSEHRLIEIWHGGPRASFSSGGFRFVTDSIRGEFREEEVQTVNFQSRSDLIARAPEGLQLNGLPVQPGLYNWNLKTSRRFGARDRQTLMLAAQSFTELIGPELRLKEKFAGVVYQILIKENHPLVWAWRSAKTDEVVARYKWQCYTAHEKTHTKAGGMCGGNKEHHLGGNFSRVLVSETIPGGQEAWLQHILDTDPALLAEFHVIYGPQMRPSDYVIEEWLESWMSREVALHAASEAVQRAFAADDMMEVERLLRRHFPKQTARGNCVFPSQCPAFALCHSGGSREAFGRRIPNHPVLGTAEGRGHENSA